MSKKNIRIPLRFKMMIVLIASLMLAALVFYGVYEIGNFLVWRYYLGESDKQERAEQYADDFQEYVKVNKLSVGDTDDISRWNPGRYADMIVYKDQNLIYAPEWFENYVLGETETSPEEPREETEEIGDVEEESDSNIESVTQIETELESVEKPESESESELSSGGETDADKNFYEDLFSGDRSFEQYLTEEARRKYTAALSEALDGNNTLHPIYFVDGTLLVAIVDFTEEAMGNIVFAVSMICALAIIALMAIIYFSTVAARLKALASNVRRIEKGDMELRVSVTGNDEISDLASDVNSMRDAIVDNMTKEKRAWEANAELITAMSHDIRTPLTVMLGYLDLIEMQNEDSTAGEYIESCRENALRLKKLSDDMFSYFLVFGKGEHALKIEAVNAPEWLAHVLGEQEILLSERGYAVERLSEIPNVIILIDESYFRRVTDNLFSNIIKYADAGSPVTISIVLDGENMLFVCDNAIKRGGNLAESNGIGLKTCVKIMEEMGGRLSHRECDGHFTVTLSIPCEKKL